ncbi:MAG: PBP1A family penicillin-binding protein [Novosphingobium sp.]|nr:PBP1A family penicillin-binding protein [Novosphingobium sp.]
MPRRDNLRRGSRRANAPPPPKRRKPQATGWRLWARRAAVWGGVFALFGALVVGISVAVAYRSLPTYAALKSSQVGQTIVVRAADGTEIVTLGPSYGHWIPYAEIPPVMKDAMVSIEDRRFRSHFGVDPIGIARAIYVSLRDSEGPRATSTITQQLARNIFLNNSRTIGRKLREAVLAMALEAKFSKDQILELYLNKVYFGGGAYGIDSASRKFFSHPATDLSLEEAAIIAGLVKAPSRYSPTADARAAVRRANIVLSAMAANGKISPGEAAQADIDAVRLAPEEGQNSARYFTDWALPQLDILIPDNLEPIEVWTTLDLGMQRAATGAISAHTPRGSQGALVSLDRDGAVLAMVGGTDYVNSNYNRATQAVRQPGSAWKLFVFLAALEAGYTPNDRVVDERVTIDGWTPRNSSGRYSGAIDMRTAFAYSINTVAAQLGNEVGFGSVASMARRFGITTPVNTMPSMVLGSSEVRVIDLTRAFAAISARGAAVEPYGVKRVTTLDGEEIYRHRSEAGSSLVPDYVAAGITDLLQTAVSTGTGRAAQIGRPVAGKTGTTSSNKDGWFLGFSSGITTGVWMGRDDARAVPGLQGGTAPARAFAAYMRYAVARRPVEKFDTELKLPEWQLEPDDEAYYGDPDDYYYVDDQGNLIEPGRPLEIPGDPMIPRDTDDEPPPPGGGLPPTAPPPQAAGDDFLDQATGRGAPDPQRPRGAVPSDPRLRPPPGSRPSPGQPIRPTATPAPRPF